MVIFSFFILLWTANSRNYESIYEVQKKVINNIHNISLNFVINGTNDYSYQLKSQDIVFYFDGIIVDEYIKEFRMYDQPMKIIFNLLIYESQNNFFDISSKDIIYSETIHAVIKFRYIKFLQEFNDFSFLFLYDINMDQDVKINFESIDNLNIFKYIFFEEKNDIYNNKTLYDFIKLNIVRNLVTGIKKSLVYYPECDSLYYLNLIIDYFTNEIFLLDYRFNPLFSINRCKVTSFNYEEIIKENRTIFLKNVNTTVFLEIYMDSFDRMSSEFFSEENVIIFLDNISIDKNRKIKYSKNKVDKEYALDALKLIVNKTEEIIENRNK